MPYLSHRAYLSYFFSRPTRPTLPPPLLIVHCQLSIAPPYRSYPSYLSHLLFLAVLSTNFKKIKTTELIAPTRCYQFCTSAYCTQSYLNIRRNEEMNENTEKRIKTLMQNRRDAAEPYPPGAAQGARRLVRVANCVSFAASRAVSEFVSAKSASNSLIRSYLQTFLLRA